MGATLAVMGILLISAFVSTPALAAATETNQSSLGIWIAELLGPIANILPSFVFYKTTIFGAEIQPIVVWMALPMIFLTYYFRFINFRGFKIAWDVVRGRYRDDKAPGDVTQFQALSTALSGTVGIGNIAGVGLAIGIGGPGATFWMIIIGFLSMSVKFAECTLGVKYRETSADGTISGGPMYYLKNGLAARGMPKLGLFLAVLYGGFGIPTIIQWATVNQVFVQVNSVTGIDGLTFGILTAVLVGAVILGGIKSIASVTSKLVPLMVIVYLGAAFVILISHFSEIPAAFAIIFEKAFAPDAVAGGILGVIIIGMKRAVYSTEAGLGTSSMVHAAAKTREPVSEGFVGLMEPFIDTVVVSTITALVIVISGAYTTDLKGIMLTSQAFEIGISWFPYLLTLAVVLFGFSTVISWGYYCEKIWTFMIGDGKKSEITYKFVYIILLIPGGVLTTTQVFDIIDSLFFMLAVPNIIGLYIMAPELKADLEDYLRRLKSGEIKKVN
jgi:AGCS family alanine or glycine:cation symporter